MHLSAYILDIAALLFLIGMLSTKAVSSLYSKKPFILGIIMAVFVILAEAGTVVAGSGGINLRTVNIFCNLVGFGLAQMIPLVITLIFQGNILGKYKLMLIPTLINAALTVLSPKFGLIFYVAANNSYSRGNYFFVFVMVYILNFLCLVVSTLKVSKKYNYPMEEKLLALSILTIFGTSIQVIDPLSNSTWHCVTLSLLLYFLLLSEFDSSFDALTGLYNRAAFEKMKKQLAEAKAYSIIVLDINDFKDINDTFGHDYGDAVIKTVAEAIQKSFNNRYTCYRLGGDEFFVFGSETNKEIIETRLRTLTSRLEEMREQGKPLPTVSYGYSIYNGGEKPDFSRTFKEADNQMYLYKKIHKAEPAQDNDINLQRRTSPLH